MTYYRKRIAFCVVLLCISQMLSCMTKPYRPGQDAPDSVVLYEHADTVHAKAKKNFKTPVIFGAAKTNVLTDIIAVPSLGLEYFLGPRFSFNIDGYYAPLNLFFKSSNTHYYSFSPEIRCWLGGKNPLQGHFIGMHANFAWYTIEWMDKDGDRVLYQNTGDGNYNNPSNSLNTPNWCFGLTYGYYLRIGRKNDWGLEFFAGAGYVKSVRTVGQLLPGKEDSWFCAATENRNYLGLTKFGMNLTYRFFHQ